MPAEGVPGIRRHVGSTLATNFLVPSTIAVQIAVATTDGDDLSEQLDVICGDEAQPTPVADVIQSNHGRVHIIEAPAGPVTIKYSA